MVLISDGMKTSLGRGASPHRQAKRRADRRGADRRSSCAYQRNPGGRHRAAAADGEGHAAAVARSSSAAFIRRSSSPSSTARSPSTPSSISSKTKKNAKSTRSSSSVPGLNVYYFQQAGRRTTNVSPMKRRWCRCVSRRRRPSCRACPAIASITTRPRRHRHDARPAGDPRAGAGQGKPSIARRSSAGDQDQLESHRHDAGGDAEFDQGDNERQTFLS